MSKMEIQTQGGTCPSYVHRPTGGGPWPAVLVFIETYPGRHGRVLRDALVYDAAAAERHWETMVALFEGTLKTPPG